MSDTKPKVLWHADGEGRCHVGCEAWGSEHGLNGCDLVEVLPWATREQPSPNRLSPCPFAVLADVLCAAKPHEEKSAPMSDEDLEHMMFLAWGCGYRYGRELPNDDHSEDIDRMKADVHSLVVHERAEVTPAHEPELHQTCENCGDDTCKAAGKLAADASDEECWQPSFGSEKSEDRRCGTCATNIGGYCRSMLFVESSGDDALYKTEASGPPWDCRFWRRR